MKQPSRRASSLASAALAAALVVGCGVDLTSAPASGGSGTVTAHASPPAIVVTARSALRGGAKHAGVVDVARLRGTALLRGLRGAKVPELDKGLAGFREKCGFDLVESVDELAWSSRGEGSFVLGARVAVPLERAMGCLGRLGFEDTTLEGRAAKKRGDTIAVAQDGVVLVGVDTEVLEVLASGVAEPELAARLTLGPGELARVTAGVTEKLSRLEARLAADDARLSAGVDLHFASAEVAAKSRAQLEGVFAKAVEEVKLADPIAPPTLRVEGPVVHAELGVAGDAEAQVKYVGQLLELGAFAARSYAEAGTRPAAPPSP